MEYPIFLNTSTLIGIYIDKIESFLREHIHFRDGCTLHQVLISILLFANNVIPLASTPKGLKRELDTLSKFCDFQ